MDDGYLVIGEWGGAPIRIHWTAAIGAFVFAGFELAPAAWLGFAVVILVHELGHALVVRACRAEVIAIDLTGVGGECQWTGRVTPLQRALIAWGGVVAQLLLFAVVRAVIPLFGTIHSQAGQEVIVMLTATNVLIAYLNLIPIRPLDGAEAWRVIPIGASLLLQRLRRQRPTARRRPTHRGQPRDRRTVTQIDARVRSIITRSTREERSKNEQGSGSDGE